jgi:hypothetical protein
MTIGEFRLQLFELVTRAAVSLAAGEILVELEDAANGCRGELLHLQLEQGTWPPDDPSHFKESDQTAASRG